MPRLIERGQRRRRRLVRSGRCRGQLGRPSCPHRVGGQAAHRVPHQAAVDEDGGGGRTPPYEYRKGTARRVQRTSTAKALHAEYHVGALPRVRQPGPLTRRRREHRSPARAVRVNGVHVLHDVTVTHGKDVTPSRSIPIMTRWQCHWQRNSPSPISTADRCPSWWCRCASSKGIGRLVHVDGVGAPDGRPGPLPARLAAARCAFVRPRHVV